MAWDGFLPGAVRSYTLRQFYPKPGQEGLETQLGNRYSSTLSLISTLDWGGWSTPRSFRFTPW